MDQLTAYQILGLHEGCTAEEIKAAYARLSKLHHPEEHPEEFRQLHEAYSCLMRSARSRQDRTRNPRQTPVASYGSRPQQDITPPRKPQQDITPSRQPQQDITPSRQPQTYSFPNVPPSERPAFQNPQRQAKPYVFQSAPQEAPSGEPEARRQIYEFDGAVEHAEARAREALHQTTMQALAEMEILLTPEYRNKRKLFCRFFQKPQYQTVLKTPEFMISFSRMLAKTKLKKPIYDFFIDYYRMRGLNPQQMFPEAAALYRVLDEKCGMRSKAKANLTYVIPVAVVSGLRAGIRNSTQSSKAAFGILLICIAVLTAFIWVYRKLYENHSSIFSQSVIASFLLVTQIIAIFTDFYAPLLGIDTGLAIAFLIFAGSGIWLAVLGIVALVRKIARISSK